MESNTMKNTRMKTIVLNAQAAMPQNSQINAQ